jgi:CubicO group peptidase (beta-lactamase class C family)
VDDLIRREMIRYHMPGLSVAVVRDGKLMLAKGYGLANVEWSVPATKDTAYQLASASKLFAATAIMTLVEEGRLSLDEKASEVLPNLPPAWRAITVRHLLSHTAGTPNYFELPRWGPLGREAQAKLSADEAIEIAAEAPLAFSPGEQFSYNQTGYVMLGRIIEKLTGKSYPQFLRERFFQPLGMTASSFGNSQAVIPRRAESYRRDDDRLQRFVTNYEPFTYPGAGLNASVVDLAKFDIALSSGKLLRRATLEEMWAPIRLKNGSTHDYGLGWSVDEYAGYPSVGHEGGGCAWYARFEKHRLTVIMLTNLFGARAEALVGKIAAYYLSPPSVTR